MAVLDRDALTESPLADLHLIANELGLDGFRRLRKSDLIDAIVARQGGESGESGEDEAPSRPSRRRSRSRSRRDSDPGDAAPADDEPSAAEQAAAEAEAAEEDEDDDRPNRSRRGRRSRRGGRGRASSDDNGGGEEKDAEEKDAADQIATGVVSLAGNGSGFVRVAESGEASDADVYISAAQVKRCELVDGDRVSGPVRRPRRSERYPSLIRIDTINDRPADEVVAGTRFDELPSAFPSERLALGKRDAVLKQIETLAPIGRGSRVAITGPARAGKTDALRRIAGALAGQEELQTFLVLAGARPEELADWSGGAIEPAAALSFSAPADQLTAAVEQTLEVARRVATRGGHAVLLVDTLDALGAAAARRVLAAARNIVDGGSLTVIATASEALGGETTELALDRAATARNRHATLDPAASGTLRLDTLIGDRAARAVAKALGGEES